MSKLDWSARWEDRVVRDVCSVGATIVLIEKQQHRSPHAKLAPFVRGVLYGSGVRVLARNPAMRGGSYRERKRRSVRLFLRRLAVLRIDASGALGRKLDDVADSFNMAIDFLLSSNPRAAKTQN
uniref:Holliday junction resolvase n=1 Tax=Rousettus bat poxvirus TaxID=3141933 RepID=A0AAU7E1U5_9POXV